MADLCREYGINRQTGYEVWQRYERQGVEGLLPRSRAPHRRPRQTKPELVELILDERRQHPSWGAKKLKAMLERERDLKLPSASTIATLLKRHGLVEEKPRRRRAARIGSELVAATKPNEVWAIDYKGEFRLGDGNYCYPLTMTDLASRFILVCDGMARIDQDAACESTLHAFRTHGLPSTIRSDNGAPFASQGLLSLTRLSALWLRLGIRLERIAPAHPEQNGSHERMHRTLKRETTRPAAQNLLAQQERFDRFVEEFNRKRPHEAIGMKVPADLYGPSERRLPDRLGALEYPLHDDVLPVYGNGVIKVGRDRVFLSQALVGQEVGVLENDDGRWLISFASLDLGHFDPATKRFEPMSAT